MEGEAADQELAPLARALAAFAAVIGPLVEVPVLIDFATWPCGREIAGSPARPVSWPRTHGNGLKQAILQLATPELEGTFDEEVARRLIAKLTA